VNKSWLAPLILALFCAGSGWSRTASAQDADAQGNKLIFAVVVNQIFNHSNLALVDEFMAKEELGHSARAAPSLRPWRR
jgi:hypothetical protein